MLVAYTVHAPLYTSYITIWYSIHHNVSIYISMLVLSVSMSVSHHFAVMGNESRFVLLILFNGTRRHATTRYSTRQRVYTDRLIYLCVYRLYAVRFLSWKYLNFKGSKKAKNIPKLDFCKDTPIEPQKRVVRVFGPNFEPPRFGTTFYAKNCYFWPFSPTFSAPNFIRTDHLHQNANFYHS